MPALASQSPADPQHDEGPETDKQDAAIVGTQQHNRQRAPQQSQRQAAHRQRASEQLTNATHRQGYQAATEQPPYDSVEVEQESGVLACGWTWQHPETTTQRPQTGDERQQVESRGKTKEKR